MEPLPPTEPAEVLEVPPVRERAAVEAEAAKVAVSELKLEGANDYPKHGVSVPEMRAELEAFRASKMAEQGGLSLFDLEDAAEIITQYYRTRGFLVAKAFVPAQDVVDGSVTIRLVEGTLGDVKVERPEKSRYSPELLTRPFRKDIGRPVIKDEIETSVLTVTDYPGLQVFGVFTPGTKVGETELTLKIQEEKPYDAMIGFDNYGTEVSGEYRGVADLRINNFLGLGDRLDLGFIGTMDEFNVYGSVGYRVPVYDGRSRVGGSFVTNAYDAGADLAEAGIGGTTRIVSLFADRDFIRSRLRNLTGSISFNHKDAEVKIDDTKLTDDSLAVLEFGAYMDLYDQYRGVNQFTFLYGHGFPDFLGALSENDPDSSRRSPSGELGGGDFNKLLMGYRRYQLISEDLSVLLQAEGQWSPDLLTSLEQFVLGGPNNVRAYPRAEFLADSGVFTSVEVFWDAPGFADQPAFWGYRWGDIFKVSAFFDYGYGWLRDAFPNQRGEFGLSGAGMALRLEVPNRMTARFQVATPIWTDDPTNDRNPQLWGEISYRF
jgi:hemolysin activation/secretion protein